MADVIPGGWKLAEMQPCNLPQEVATGYNQVVQSLVGADYTPVLYVGQQVVAGMNYMIICKQKIVVPDPPEHLVEVIINSAPTTGAWSLVRINQIV